MRKGQSLVELLVAIAVGAILFIGATLLIVPSLKINQSTGNVQTAAELGKELLDNARVWSEGSWPSVLNLATGTSNKYYLNTASSPFTAINVVFGGSSYSFSRSITISNSLASGTLSSFPMLFSGTYSWLAASSSGGNVQNGNGYDIAFSANSNCGSMLNFETESYTSSTGAIIDWVNVPSMSAGAVIYVCYGSASVATDQSHPSSTWDSNYQAVYHLPNGKTLTANDSTNNANNGTLQNAPNPVTGQIGGAAEIQRGPGFDQDIITGSASSLNITGKLITIEAWFKRNNLAMVSNNIIFQRGLGGTGGYEFDVSGNATSASFAYIVQGVTYISIGAISDDTNWHHVVLVSDNSNAGVYVDGVLSAGTFASFSILPITTTSSIGPANSASANNDYDVDEVRVSNTNRSPSWILTEYNNQSNPSAFYTVGSASVPH